MTDPNEKKSPLTVVPPSSPENGPWYKEGLRFSCTECGKCCTGSPGYVWVSIEEIQAIADHFQLSVQQVADKYLRLVGNRWSLCEKGDDYDCIFLEGKRCSIYSIRPKQCRTFPWWKDTLASQQAWEEAKRSCEGISDEAPVVPLAVIEAALNQ